MLAFLFSPLGKIAGAGALVVAGIVGFMIWLGVHDDNVKAALVAQYEQQAAAHAAQEAQRQATASKAATDALNAKLASAKAAEAKQTADLEQRIKTYETALAAAHRDCLADDADVDFIVHDKPAPVGLSHH